MKYLTALIAGLLISVHLAGQNYAGHMYDNETSQAVGYVSIGIVGKAVGTVSDGNGAYNLVLESQYDADTLKFTCIGYQSVSMKVGDYKNRSDQNIYFQPAPKPIEEVVILGKQFIQRTLGITSTTKNCYGGFKDCGLGYELGLQMNVRKPAVIERLHLNIVVCTYDSIFYRMNVYKVTGRKRFENILDKPIYLSLSKDKISETVTFDLKQYHIAVEGDFVITLEHVKDLGHGDLFFSAELFRKTFYKEKSHDNWQIMPFGVSISADVREER